MSLFDIMKYPVSLNFLPGELESLPPTVLDKWIKSVIFRERYVHISIRNMFLSFRLGGSKDFVSLSGKIDRWANAEERKVMLEMLMEHIKNHDDNI